MTEIVAAPDQHGTVARTFFFGTGRQIIDQQPDPALTRRVGPRRVNNAVVEQARLAGAVVAGVGLFLTLENVAGIVFDLFGWAT